MHVIGGLSASCCLKSVFLLGAPSKQSARGICRSRNGSRSPSSATLGCPSARSPTGSAARRRRCPGSCAGCPPLPAGIRPFEAHRDAIGSRARHHRHPSRATGGGRRTTRPAVEPAADRPASAQEVPHQASVRLCHESIYQALYQAGSTLVRPATVPSPRPSPLRTGRDHREAHQRIDRRRPRFEQLMLSVHQRPFPPDDRSEAG